MSLLFELFSKDIFDILRKRDVDTYERHLYCLFAKELCQKLVGTTSSERKAIIVATKKKYIDIYGLDVRILDEITNLIVERGKRIGVIANV